MHGNRPFGIVIEQNVQGLLGMSLVLDPSDSTSKSSLQIIILKLHEMHQNVKHNKIWG